MTYEPITILSAELPSLDYHTNMERTSLLRMDLLNKGYSIVGVKVNGLTGFVVTTDKLKPLVKLAVKYDQETIYFSDKTRDTLKFSTLRPKTGIPLGKLLKSSKSVNINSSKRSELTLTFIEDGKQHVFSTEQ